LTVNFALSRLMPGPPVDSAVAKLAGGRPITNAQREAGSRLIRLRQGLLGRRCPGVNGDSMGNWHQDGNLVACV
jgi:hypothetical protein